MADSVPLISVIIPAWNSERCIAGVLDALTKQDADPALFEVIVIDNGSTDRTPQVAARYPIVTLLSEPKPGSYNARNKGLAAARGEYLLFTDADCVPTADWVANAQKRITDFPEIDVHAGRVRLFREPGARPFATRYEELTAFNQEGNVAAGFCVTANMLCRRAHLMAIGGFNGALLSGGDVDCSRRLTGAGYKLGYAPDMVVAHPTRAVLGALIDKRRRVVGGRWQIENWGAGPVSVPMGTLMREAYNELRWIKGSSIEWWAKPGVLTVSLLQSIAAQLEVARLKTGRPAFRN